MSADQKFHLSGGPLAAAARRSRDQAGVASPEGLGVLCSVGGVDLTLADVQAVPEEVVTAASMAKKGSYEWGLVRLQLAAAIKEAA